MAADVSKHLERAKRFLEKSRAEDAIQAYLTVLDEAPQHQEATQALGDLYARTGQADRATVYYGMLFDLLVEPKDETKALALFNRFLRNSTTPQPPERIARYAFLQQRQNHSAEALEQYTKAAELFTAAGREEDALFCWERAAQLEPENLARQLRLAESAAHIGKNAIAARAFLRAGQLASSSGDEAEALSLLERSYKLAPQERSVSLLYAEASLRVGDAAKAAALLDPFAASENDAAFLNIFGNALMRAGQFDRAKEIFERLLKDKNEGVPQLFELADHCATAGQDSKSLEILQMLKRRMFSEKRQNEFTAQLDALGGKHPQSQVILEFWAGLYSELNRESQYFEIMLKLFDVYAATGNYQKASESIERLVDIDSYDHRNQQRLEALRGHVDEAFLKRVASRMASSAASAAPPPRPAVGQSAGPPQPVTDEGRKLQALEDLIVQTEIFLQYSLQSKALERLQKIASMFPGEEERNTRLRNLYQLANWWPQGARPTTAEPTPEAPTVEAQAVTTGKTGVYSADTLRDLSKISEINQKIFRQQTPRAMLNTAVTEVGTYLQASRALAVAGAQGRPPELAAEFCPSGARPSAGAQVVLLLAQFEKAVPDDLGGLTVESGKGSILAELGLASALGRQA